MVVYTYLNNHIRVLRLRTPFWCHNNQSIPGAGVAISKHWLIGLNAMGTASPSLRKDQEWSHKLRRLSIDRPTPTIHDDSDAQPVNVARTADRYTKIHLYIR